VKARVGTHDQRATPTLTRGYPLWLRDDVTHPFASPLWGGQREERSEFERVGVRRFRHPHPLKLAPLAFAGLPTRGRQTFAAAAPLAL